MPDTMLTATTAKGGGYVSLDGGAPVTARGICWGTSPLPTISGNHTTNGTGLGFFTSTITGLSGCGTHYYVRAYATNSYGTGYGNQYIDSTGLLPTIVTTTPTSITPYSAISGGNVVSDGGCAVTERGLCWNFAPNPTIDHFKTVTGSGTGSFTVNMSNLGANVTYYVRAYAINSLGIVYGPEQTFTTTTPSGLYIGKYYAGGRIFYLDGTGQHGMVYFRLRDDGVPWRTGGSGIPFYVPNLDSAFGTGQQNTAAIIASLGVNGPAAYMCDTLINDGYNDWYLPSSSELRTLHHNIFPIGYFGNLYWGPWGIVVYWSSYQDAGGHVGSLIPDQNGAIYMGAWVGTISGAVIAVRNF
jgi:hypothetical protein